MSQNNSNNSNNVVTGGCDQETRGQAVMERMFGNATEKFTPERYAANKVVHCKSPSSNCPNTDRFNSYQNKK